MVEQEKEYLESIYAGLAMVGFLMKGDYSIEEIPSLSKRMARAMMEDDTEVAEGIVAIKKKKYIKKT
jgi:hypothetical protein